MMIDTSDCITLVDTDRTDRTSNWTRVTGIFDNCSSVNAGRQAERPVFLKSSISDATMVPIGSMVPYSMVANTASTSRITRRTQTVMKITDTEGGTLHESHE